MTPAMKEGVRPLFPWWPQDPRGGGTDDDPSDGEDESPDRPPRTPQPDTPNGRGPLTPPEPRPA